MNHLKVECIPKCFIISLKRKSHSVKGIGGEELYNRFVSANSRPYWNLDLKDVLENCEFYGFVKPYNILLKAEDIFIQSLRLAQEKRLLKPPEGFIISFVGETEPTKCSTIHPSQFVALDEALCYIIYDLNLRSESSTFDIICTRLAEWYSGLQLPPQSLILATLRSLLNAGQVYYTGYGYNILTTDKAVVAQWLQEQSPHAPLARVEVDPDEPVQGSLTAQEDCGTEDEEIAKENCQLNKDKEKEDTKQPSPHYMSQYPPAIFLAPANLSWDNARGYVIKDGHAGTSSRKKKGKSKSVVKNFFSRFRSATTSSSGIKTSLSPRPRASTAEFGYPGNRHHSHGNVPGIIVDDDDLDGVHGPLYAPASMMTQSVMSGTYGGGTGTGSNLRSHVRQGHWLWHTSLQSLPPAETTAMPFCHGYPTSSPHHNAKTTNQPPSHLHQQQNYQNSTEFNPPKSSYNSLNVGRRSVSNHSRLSTEAIHDESPPKRSTSFTHALSRHNKHSRRHRSNSGRHDSKGHSDRSSSKQRKSHKKSSKKHHHSSSNQGDNEIVGFYPDNQGVYQPRNRIRKESGSNECEYENSGLLAGSSPPSVYRMKLGLSGNYMFNYGGGGGGGCDSGVHSVSGSQAPAGVGGIVLVGGTDYYGYTPNDGGTGNKRSGNHRHFRSLELDPSVTGPRSSSFRSCNSKSNAHSKLSSKSFNTKLPSTSNTTQLENNANHTNHNNNSHSLDPVIESQNNACSINRNRLSNSFNNQSDYKRHVAFQEQNR